jgi:hypothetical protein
MFPLQLNATAKQARPPTTTHWLMACTPAQKHLSLQRPVSTALLMFPFKAFGKKLHILQAVIIKTGPNKHLLCLF